MILVFRDHLLPTSETFVRAQGEALRTFIAHYAGSRIIDGGLALPSDRVSVVNRGGIAGRFKEAGFKLLGVAPGFYRRMRRLGPVLVHAHFGPDAVLALPLARFLAAPLVVTFHGYDATVTDDFARRSFYGHRKYLAKRAALQRQARLFFAVSNFVRGKLIRQGFPPEKIMVHYIGVDVLRFQPEIGARRERTVLFVGRLVEKKGCAFLIDAMALVQDVIPDVRLVVIGDGPLRSDLERRAAALRSCRFLGAQPQATVQEWMNRASVFSVPSVTAASGDAEGFGLVFAEAQAMGLPVASFRSGGIPEAVAHGSTGLLVPEGDVRGLAEAIRCLLTDVSLWQACSEAGIARVRRLFDLRAQTALLEEAYTSVLSDRNR